MTKFLALADGCARWKEEVLGQLLGDGEPPASPLTAARLRPRASAAAWAFSFAFCPASACLTASQRVPVVAGGTGRPRWR